MDLLSKINTPVLRDNRKCGEFDWAGAIGSGLNFIGGLIGNHTNKKLVRETNAMTRELTEMQMALQQQQFQQQMDYQTMDWQRNRQALLEDWIRNNDYNDPRSQMARYAAAGLNPYLMMFGQNAAIANTESVAGGSSPSPGSMPSVPNFQVPHDDTSQVIDNAIGRYLQAKQVESDSAVKQEQAAQLAIDNRSRNVRNYLDLANLRADLQNKVDEHKLNGESLKKAQREIDILDDTIAVLGATFDSRVKAPHLQNLATRYAGEKLEVETRIAEFEDSLNREFARDERLAKLRIDQRQIGVLSATISNIIANTDLTNQQFKTEVAKTVKEWFEANKINPDSEQGKQAFDFIESQIWKNYEVRDPRGNTYTSGDYYKRRNVKKLNRRYSR